MSAPLLTILTIAGVTVLIRFLPFLIFRSDRRLRLTSVTSAAFFLMP